MQESARETRKVLAGQIVVTKPPVEVTHGTRIMAKAARDDAGAVIFLTTTGCTTNPFVSRKRRKMPWKRQMLCRSLLLMHGSSRSRKTVASCRNSNYCRRQHAGGEGTCCGIAFGSR